MKISDSIIFSLKGFSGTKTNLLRRNDFLQMPQVVPFSKDHKQQTKTGERTQPLILITNHETG